MTTTKTPSLYDAYETDKSLEEEGAWVEFRNGAKVRIRSETSAPVREYANKLAKSQRNLLQANGWVLPPKMADRNEVLTCRNAIITGWQNVTDRDGNDVPFTPDNVERVLTELPRFRADILFAAKTDETYRTTKEEMLGNSEAPSKDSSTSADAATTSSPQPSSEA